MGQANRGAYNLPALNATTFAAVIAVWDGTLVADQRADATAARLTIEELTHYGVHVAVVSDAHVGEIDRQLAVRPRGPGTVHYCVDRGSEVYGVTSDGPVLIHRRTASPSAAKAAGLTDESDSARWMARWLNVQGVSGRLILVAGNDFGSSGGIPGRDARMLVAELARAAVVSVGPEPGGLTDGVLGIGGGPTRFQQVLDGQLERHRSRRVPSIDPDPAWVMTFTSTTTNGRALGAITTLANGRYGTRGGFEEDGESSLPLVVANGVYTSGPTTRLLPGPLWTGLDIGPSNGHRRLHLDLRTGVLAREGPAGVRTMRFTSAAHTDLLALRAEGPDELLRSSRILDTPDAETGFEAERRGDIQLARTMSEPDGGGIAVAARQTESQRDGQRFVERLAVCRADSASVPGWDEAVAVLGELPEPGFDCLLGEHRRAWASRWADAMVTIDGDAGAEIAARFAVFHVLSSATAGAESAVGARGLTGAAYGGHVFWDADIFVLPVLAAIDPGAARAMLDYRVARLPAARALARANGYEGARFPWESAGVGSDVTPRSGIGIDGHPVDIVTGQREEHIVADVAWAASRYVEWSGDVEFLQGAGRDLVCDTARYWASRIDRDADGSGHLRGVMGPDEYHELVDDNAFTNAMARWNLRRGAELVQPEAPSLSAEWRTLADALIDGYDHERGLHEQFAGYWDLEPLLAADVHSVPFAADLLIGAERCAHSQLIKQADVVMAHHLFPDDMAAGSASRDLAFYKPRCSQGSSLSPAIHASQLARAGRPDEALQFFQLAANLSLRDITKTTSGGVQLAALGGVWQALAHGFLGLQPRADRLVVDPHLPASWRALEMTVRFRGQRVVVRAEHHEVFVRSERALIVESGEHRLRHEITPNLAADPGGNS